MQSTPDNLNMLSGLLTQSLSPQPEVRHPAEKNLESSETQQGFLLLVLDLVRSESVAMHLRQAAGVYFKNVVKKRWTEENDIPAPDRAAIRSHLIPIMVSLSTAGASRLQAQIGEAVAEIAEMDFPERWPTLIDELVGGLSPDNFAVNNGVLTTAHSIFRRWRSQFQSNDLFTSIKLVLEKFCVPYTALFKRVDQLLSSYPSSPLPGTTTVQEVAQSLQLLVELYHDLNCQDFPEYFEDHNAEFMGDVALAGSGDPAGFGLLGKYLRWELPELMGSEDDDVGGPIQSVRAGICEIAQLYALKYSDAFPQLGLFVEGVWRILSSVGMGTRDDHFVGRALGFLSVVVKMGSHKQLFEAQQTLEDFCRLIILPNMTIRPHEEEMFEDDPMEFIRQDLEASTEHDTRRSAATEFTQALMQLFEQQITSIIGGHITQYLALYNSNPAQEWKAKDTAIYLLTSIASRGSTQHQGVTSINTLIDVVTWFSQNIFADLQAESSAVHPILQVDAIKYLYTFRNQLTKEQLVSVLPLLVRHLEADNYVIYSFAAITIERILFIKQNGSMLFTHLDVQPFAENVLMACFGQIQKATTPEKIAENDHLMKCVMRVIITAKQALVPSYQAILQRLVAIIAETSKNPSNPKFNQYNFESISALIRYICSAQSDAIAHFEGALFPPIQYMLASDVSEFIPFAFQILAQLLELHSPVALPPAYENLLGPLLHSSLWESRGNVPALVRLWKALLVRGGPIIAARGHVQALLGIFQKLITLKSTDVSGLELIGLIYESIPKETMAPFTQTILTLMLTRLQGTKAPAFRQAFAIVFLLLCALPNVGPEFIVGQLQNIQNGLLVGILESIVLPETRKTPAKDRKVVSVGLTNLLTKGDVLLQPTLVSAWPMILEAAIDVFMLPQDVKESEGDNLEQLDPEETSFQASFSKLGASEPQFRDPLSAVPDAKRYLAAELAATSARHPGKLQALMQPLPQETLQAFMNFMTANGLQLA